MVMMRAMSNMATTGVGKMKTLVSSMLLGTKNVVVWRTLKTTHRPECLPSALLSGPKHGE